MALATRGLHSFLAEPASTSSSNVATARGSATFGQKPFVGHNGARPGTAAFPASHRRNSFSAPSVSTPAVLERRAGQQRLAVEPTFQVCPAVVTLHPQHGLGVPGACRQVGSAAAARAARTAHCAHLRPALLCCVD